MTISVDTFGAAALSGTTATVNVTVSANSKMIVAWSFISAGSDLDSLTFGGIAMQEVSGSPIDNPTSSFVVHCHILPNPPTGNKNCVLTNDAGPVGYLCVLSINADYNLAIADLDTSLHAAAQTNPSVTLSALGKTVFACIGFLSGQNAVSGITPFANWTVKDEFDFTDDCSGVYTYDILGTSDVSAGWTQTSDDATMIALALYEYIPPLGRPNAVDFDGTNDTLSRAALTGVSNGRVGTISFWINMDEDGTQDTIFRIGAAGNYFLLEKTSTNKIRLLILDAATNLVTELDISSSTNSILAASGWQHVLISWDLTTGTELSDIYIQDVSDQTVTTRIGAVDLEYTDTTYITHTSNLLNGKISELCVNLAEYVDITTPTGRRKFTDLVASVLYAKPLGRFGRDPTGNQPAVYMHDEALTYGTNFGSGGDFTITGILDNVTPPALYHATAASLGQFSRELKLKGWF